MSESKSGKPDCEIQELVQFACHPSKSAPGQIDCSPVVRFFRICVGRPAVEITKFVSITDDGGVTVPRNIDVLIPKARSFSEIAKHETNTDPEQFK
ncbi:hypothetical protein CPB85DRAFT_1436053 [Mucidula mucida]|nr:hypothetical protein CPB85DRAFT_1436053 [Mucidula mucida]